MPRKFTFLVRIVDWDFFFCSAVTDELCLSECDLALQRDQHYQIGPENKIDLC